MVDLLQPRYCVANNLHRVTRAVTRIYSEEMRPCGIKRSQFAILAHLAYRENLPIIQLTELADLMIMDRTTLSRNLKPLEKQGLVLINKSTTDGRARELTISKQGRVKFEEALKLWRKAQKRLLKTIGESHWLSLEASLADLSKQVI